MSEPPIDKDPAPGDLIGERYRIVRRLGAGGIGVVFEAENTWTRRRVAIKLLQAQIASDPEQLERFRTEAQTTSALRHPNIVDVLDMGPDGQSGRLFIIQELLDGETLQSVVSAKKPLSPRAAFELLVPVMGALSAAHAKGVLHRDIKPGNIVLARDEHGEVTPKVIDFGLAKVLHDDPDRRKTRTGSIVGTPYYMSPEQARGGSDVDARIDVWAIGVVLYELMSGRVPFDGDNVLAVMWNIASKPCPRLDETVPSVPRAVAEVLARALANERDDRYPTMDAFLEAVLACPALESPGEPSLTIACARSLPPALVRRTSSPSLPPRASSPGASTPASLPGVDSNSPARPDLRATPLGWMSSSAGRSSVSRRGLWPIAGGVLLVALVTFALARRARSPETMRGSSQNALTTTTVAPRLPSAVPSAVEANTEVLPAVAGSAPTQAPSAAQPAAAPSFVAREEPRRGARRLPRRAAPSTTPAAAAPAPSSRPVAPTRHAPAFDPERLLEDTH